MRLDADIQWSITTQPSGSSVLNPPNGVTASVTPTHLGKYVIKASCGTSSDTFDLYSYQIEFEKNTTDTHISMEGQPSGESLALPGPYGSYTASPTSSSFIGASNTPSLSMSSDAAAYIAAKGPGSWLQPSGEVRYDFFLNIGSATADVKMVVILSPGGSVSPVSTLIKRGAGPAICTITATTSSTQKTFSYSKTVKTDGSGTQEIITGSNPVIYLGTVSGRLKIGYIEAGVGYENHGASNGNASSAINGNFSVEKP